MSTTSNITRGLVAAGIALTTTSLHADVFEIDGRTVEVRFEGEGTPVIFVHGALSDLRVWDGVIDALAKNAPDRRLVSYTQRHFGPGDAPIGLPEDFSRDTHVSDLIRVAETVGNGTPATLVTWSYGGEIGLHAMMRRPELFGAAIHYEPILYPLLSDLPGGRRAMQEKVRTVFAPAVGLAKQGNLDGAALRFIEGVFQMPEGSAAEAKMPWPTIWRNNSRTIPAYGAMAPLPVGCEDLGAITAPTIIVEGGDSHIDTVMMADRVSECLDNALTLIVPGANHGIPMRSPERFAEMISDVLNLLR
ncbi:alpha/beta fold hydrolase [Mangrovicoccus sp. HB161399]|uniref:alpha/beta fold hydrolase n=1 Tax=Mangrovicoccus sp. HB161399 TaxID=2720392 RepID=UPI001557DB5D|nr:alpha/beta hydrolase [Mangrovicoccus sp. HB161399]